MSTVSAAPATMTGLTAASAAAGIGFKEWLVVCEALGHGRQSLILRKGGIAEGREGFRFKHDRFFLFPTRFHQQYEKVRPGERQEPVALPNAAAEEEVVVAIRLLVAVEFACWVDRWERLAQLEPFHIWREDVVRERFEYEDQRGLQCAFGRVYRASRPWTFPNRPVYGGCRSWVTLPTPPDDLDWTPVLGEDEHARRRREIRGILDAA